MNKDMENHPYLNHSKKDRCGQSLCSPSWILLPTYDKRERDVWVLDPKGLVDKYLGTQGLDTTQMYSIYHEG
jgi:hypothetical protein